MGALQKRLHLHNKKQRLDQYWFGLNREIRSKPMKLIAKLEHD